MIPSTGDRFGEEPENNPPPLRIVTGRSPQGCSLGEAEPVAFGKEPRLEPGAVAALYLEHADELRAFLVGVLKDRELAGEALQNTFAKAVEAGHTSREETRKGWLFRVAYHEALALKRRRRVEERSLPRLAAAASEADDPGEAPHPSAVRWETVEQVRKAIDALPAEQKRVVWMRIYEEKTFAAIAAELDLPLGTVLTRMQLAIKKLSSALQSHRQPS